MTQAVFVGIDISKAHLDVAIRPSGERHRVANEETAIRRLVLSLVERSPTLLRLRLLAALGRCSAGAVNTSGAGAQNGRTRQPVDDVSAGKLAPRAGFEPATHGLTVRGGGWPTPRDDNRMRHLRR